MRPGSRSSTVRSQSTITWKTIPAPIGKGTARQAKGAALRGPLRDCQSRHTKSLPRNRRRAMAMPELAPVLDQIDRSVDESLERLFGLLAIPSISTDPVYAAEC